MSVVRNSSMSVPVRNNRVSVFERCVSFRKNRILLCCSLYCCACMFVVGTSCMSCSQLMHARCSPFFRTLPFPFTFCSLCVCRFRQPRPPSPCCTPTRVFLALAYCLLVSLLGPWVGSVPCALNFFSLPGQDSHASTLDRRWTGGGHLRPSRFAEAGSYLPPPALSPDGDERGVAVGFRRRVASAMVSSRWVPWASLDGCGGFHLPW